MKINKNTMIVVSVAVIILSMVITIASLANNNNLNANKENKTEDLTGIDMVKTVSVAGSDIEVSFSEQTTKINGEKNYIYKDEDGVEYYFDLNGTYLGTSASLDHYDEIVNEYTENSDKSPIDENEAREIAESEARAQFKEQFDLVEYIKTEYDGNDGMYIVRFAQMLGDDKFCEGITCTVKVLPDGSVNYCKMPNLAELSDFDETLLSGISAEELENDMYALASGKYSDKLTGFSADYFKLMRSGDKYVIRAGITCTLSADDGTGYKSGEVIEYSLPLSDDLDGRFI